MATVRIDISDFINDGYEFPATGGTLEIYCEENSSEIYSIAIALFNSNGENVISDVTAEDYIGAYVNFDDTIQSWLVSNLPSYDYFTISITVPVNETTDTFTGEADIYDANGDLIARPSLSQVAGSSPAPVWGDGQHKIYRSGSQVMKMYRSGEMIYLRLNPPSEEPEPPTPPTPVLPSNTFLINYNAKFYNNSTFTIPKTEGQLFNEDMVLNAAASSYTSDHITVNGQYFEKSFGSTGANPFNLTNSSPFTLIAKTSRGFDTSGEHSLASCRSGGLNWILFNPGNGSGADKVFMHNANRFASGTPFVTITSEPNIYAIRINNGSGYGQSYTDSTTERSISVSYNGNSDRFGIFTDTYRTGGFELWKGDFYWMYISTEALTDDEIQQVINYNENINPTNE